MDEPPRTCPLCGRSLPATAAACQCEQGLLELGLKEETQAPPKTPRYIGEYEVGELIARGGMGAVYRARHVKLGARALKLLIGGEWAGEHARLRFWREAELAAHVERPHIVPIYEVGEWEGQPYFAMPLMAASLADRARKFHGMPRRAAELLLPVARAIDFGHRRNVVHLDLKPANILLDKDEVPFVGDFGISRRLDTAPLTAERGFVGTPGYMAPEQAGTQGDLTEAVDVWGLGAVLYDLVCGQTPFEPKLDAESLRKLREDDPPRPRSLLPALDEDFEAIVLMCLEKDPDDRYRTAADLADDLQRFLEYKPVKARPISAWRRASRWCRRYPARAALVTSLLCFAGVLAGRYVQGAGELEQELREEVLRTNTWIAEAQAGTVESKLRALDDVVAAAAASEALMTRLAPNDPPRLAAPADTWRSMTFGSFDSFMLLDRKGSLVDRRPPAPGYVGHDFSFRSYFPCALRLAERRGTGPCVSGAYLSEIDKAFRFAVARPVLSSTGRLLGVAVGTLKADSLLVSLVIPERVASPSERNAWSKRGRSVSLAARRDPERSEKGPVPVEWLLLRHESLPLGGSVVAKSPLLREPELEKPASDSAYIDPIVGDRWLAGLAPVKDAPWVTIVQTREAIVVDAPGRWTMALRDAAALAAAAGLGVGLASYLIARGRSGYA